MDREWSTDEEQQNRKQLTALRNKTKTNDCNYSDLELVLGVMHWTAKQVKIKVRWRKNETQIKLLSLQE